MSPSDSGLTAAERGETVPRRLRVLIRVVAVLVLIGATVGVAVVREQMHRGTGLLDVAVIAKWSVADRPRAPDPETVAERTVRVLDREDARLRTATVGEAVGASTKGRSVVLGARPAPYTLRDLVRAGAATRVSPDVVELRRPVVVRRDARLLVDAPGTTLRLVAGQDGITSVVSWGGAVTLSGDPQRPLRIVGWQGGRRDTSTADGRGYVRVKDGTLRVEHAELTHLGFWSGRTGGLALTGSDETTTRATLRSLSLDDLHIGLYVSGGRRVSADRIRVHRPSRHGIELTNRSAGIRLRHLDVRAAGEDAVSVTNGTSRVTIDDATLQGSGGYGLDVDGSPLATGPNSAGYGVGNYSGVTLRDSELTDNAAGAARLRSVDDVRLERDLLVATPTPLVVRGEADGVRLEALVVETDDPTGVLVEGGVTGLEVVASEVTSASTGVEVRHSEAVLSDNTITVGTGHGVLLVGSATTATLAGNTISGEGSGAVRSEGDVELSEEGGSGEWNYRPEALMWMEAHTALLPLLLVLVVPAAGAVFIIRRRRQQRELRALMERTLIDQGRAALAAYRGRVPEPVAEPVVAEPVVVEPVVVEPVVEPVIEPSVPEPVPVPEVPVPEVPVPEVLVPEPAAAPEVPLPVAARSSEPVELVDREFETARQFAVAAVLESGYSPTAVARVLKVPTSRVRAWVESARAGLAPTA